MVLELHASGRRDIDHNNDGRLVNVLFKTTPSNVLGAEPVIIKKLLHYLVKTVSGLICTEMQL